MVSTGAGGVDEYEGKDHGGGEGKVWRNFVYSCSLQASQVGSYGLADRYIQACELQPGDS